MTQLLHCWGYFKHFVFLLSLWLQGEVAACQARLQRTVCQAMPAAFLLQLCRPEAESRVCSPTVPAAGGFIELGLVSQLCSFDMWA